ncbi:MAG: WGR domain-containing protein, partial [Kofleriaceae bacterium]
ARVRVIEQARLAFREGTSDKVYEVDLVEVATNQYVVNFRFGRRGTALRDGTKTATPVALAKAKTIFDKLVAEKTAGGYKSGGAAAPASGFDIVTRLRAGVGGDGQIGAVVWKASDRDLREAEPALLALLDGPAPEGLDLQQWHHVVVAALARCGSTASLSRLQTIVENPRAALYVRDAARVAITRIDPGGATILTRHAFTPAIAAAYDRRDPSALARAVDEALAANHLQGHTAVIALYLLDDAVARAAVFAAVRIARIDTAEAITIRTLFRLAEIRRDGELYVACARRIDALTGTSRPFGTATREYLRRRTARVLRRLGRADSADYARMAAAWLCAYSDADAQASYRGRHNAWWDTFARYHTLNEILYKHSPRYEVASPHRSAWRCSGTYRPAADAPPPPQREEAFPALWDRAPDLVWQVLEAGRAAPVAEFAVRAVDRAYAGSRPDDAVARVLGGGHAIAQRFAFELAKQRTMSTALARGALASVLVEAHTWVLRWITANTKVALEDAELLALLVTGRTAAIRDAGLAILRSHTLDGELAKSVAARALALLLGLDGSAESEARAAAAVAVVLRVLDAPLREIGADVLADLIAHPLAALGELAGELVLRHAHRDRLPHTLIEAMLASPHASVRALGSRLVAMTPAEIAKDDIDALELFATSANRELREGTRSLIGEVARREPEIGRELAQRLVEALLRAQPEGAPAFIVSLLRSELAEVLPQLPVATILRLVNALSTHAREAGGLLLSQLGPDDVTLDDIARLAGNELLVIRQGAWALARASIARYRMAPVAIAKLVDSAWEDTRTVAIELVHGELADRLTADAIITICDSIRPEVQAVGKALLLERFDSADGGRYLVRLAEHPSPGLQLLVSGLLEHHLGDLDKLVPFLTTVLSLVNRGGVAKQRVLALLRRESMRSPEAAAILAPVLDRQSATIAVSQKAPLIATMVDVRTAFPEVDLPITITPPAPHPRRGPS